VEGSTAEIVLAALNEVFALDDVQEIVDRACECTVAISPFRLALLSLYFDEDVYIGLEGGDAAMRQRFFDHARASDPDSRREKRRRMWERYRLGETDICFIPEGSDLPFGEAFERSPETPGTDWRPEDRLMIFVRGADGGVRGVLSLDNPCDGLRPDPSDLGPLEAVEHLTKLIGVLVHNKHLAKKLRESEERYAAVVEQGHDGILIARGDRVLFANRRVAELVGREQAELVGRELHELLPDPVEGESQLRNVEGADVAVTLRMSTVRFGDGDATLIAVADTSEHQRTLAQLIRAQKLESVGTLASGIAHDFNNLLGGIIGYASLLHMRLTPDDPSTRYVESIEKAAERAAGVTRQLLGIVRDERSRKEPFHVCRVIEEVAGLLQETLDPRIRVVIRCEDDLPLVVGDETQIHQVILNVCLNARDAMENRGTLLLGVESVGDEVRIRVSDTGPGMSPGTLEKVFDPFYTTKSGGHGSGLGLYMAYRIVERHGGSIDIDSTPGRGTTVEILLPACVAGVREESDARAADIRGGGTVLLVDDEPVMLEVGTEMIRRLGYGVIPAHDGAEAVAAVDESNRDFHCVVMDIAMPVVDGWEASRRIQELRPETPIIVCSGHDISAETGETHGVAVVSYLSKPYTLDDMRTALAAADAFTASATS